MNLNNFKLLKEDDENYHVGHPNGKAIAVSKKGLSEKAHALIKKLKTQHFDEGGEAIDPNAVATSVETGQPMMSPLAANTLITNPPPEVGMDPMRAPASTPAPQVPVEANGIAAPNSLPALQDERNALLAGAQAEGQEGQTNAKNLHDANERIAAEETFRQNEFEQAQKRSQDLFDAYQSKKIDPNHYWGDKKTGSKILAGIGMALSGMGSGMTGQPNLAMENINRAIQRDIEAQKDDQSKAMNLYKMNREMTHDNNEAHLLTENQLLTGVKSKMMEASALAQNAVARARIAPAIAQIDQQIEENNFKRSVMKSGNQIAQIDPSVLVPRFVPKEHQKEVFNEIKQAQGAAENGDFILKNFDKAAKRKELLGWNPIQRVGALASAIPGYDIPEIKAINAMSLPMIHDAEGRVNEFEQKTIRDLLPAVLDTDATLAKKRSSLEAFINQKKSAPTAKGFGIDLEKFNSTTSNPLARMDSKQQEYYRWAKSTIQKGPSDPNYKMAQLTLQKLGVQ